MADFAGFAPGDLAAYFGVSPAQGLAIMDLANQSQLSPADLAALGGLPQSRFSPGASGPDAGYGDIAWGLQHLSEHPAGSHYGGDFSVKDLALNFATGGYYGLGQSVYNAATGKGNVVGDLKAGLNQLGPYGSVTYPISPKLAETGNAVIGVAAGLAGGFGAAGGFGGSGAEAGAAGAGPGVDLGPGAFMGVNASGESLYLVKTASGVVEMTAQQAEAAGIPSLTGAGASGISGSQALANAQTGQQVLGLAGRFAGGSQQLTSPIGGAYTGTGTSGQQLTPQQRAALISAMQSEPHRGLAPSFESRQAGKQEDQGIASLRNLSGGY